MQNYANSCNKSSETPFFHGHPEVKLQGKFWQLIPSPPPIAKAEWLLECFSPTAAVERAVAYGFTDVVHVDVG